MAGRASVLPAGVTDRGKASKEAGVDLGPSLSSFFFFKSTTDGEETQKKTKIKKKTKKRNKTTRHAGKSVALCETKTAAWSVVSCRVALREAGVCLAPFSRVYRYGLQLKDVQLCSARALLSPSVSGACLSLALSAPRQLIGFTHEVGAGSHHSRVLMKEKKKTHA